MTKKQQQPTWRKYTFIVLIIAGLAFVSTLLFLITRGLLNMGVFSGATADTLNRGTLISGGVTILALAFYAMLEPEKLRQLAHRQAGALRKQRLHHVHAAFMGILVVGNVLVFQNPQRWDVTEDKQNTLAPETIQALETLPEPVTAVAFYSTSLSTQGATELLDNFKVNSRGKFNYRFVNPDTDPIAAREAGVTGDGKILLVMGEREIANFASETELTKTLIKLINPEARAVYFLTGHGEGSLDFSEVSFATAKRTLESKNYTVSTLNLPADNKIPEDALAVIIAGPMKPVSEDEVDLLKEYVDAGGSLVVMQNPVLFTDFGNSPDPLAKYLTDEWGITLNDDVIIDLNSQQPLYAVSAQYSQHPITTKPEPELHRDHAAGEVAQHCATGRGDHPNRTDPHLAQLMGGKELSQPQRELRSLSRPRRPGRSACDGDCR
jgi:hypothetical protein